MWAMCQELGVQVCVPQCAFCTGGSPLSAIYKARATSFPTVAPSASWYCFLPQRNWFLFSVFSFTELGIKPSAWSMPLEKEIDGTCVHTNRIRVMKETRIVKLEECGKQAGRGGGGTLS